MVYWCALLLLVLAGMANCGPQFHQHQIGGWNLWHEVSPGAYSDDGEAYQENAPAPADDEFDEESAPSAFSPGDASAQSSFSSWQDGLDSAAEAAGVGSTDDIAGMRELDRLERRRSEWSRKLDEEERKLDDLIQMNRTVDMFNNENYNKELHEIWRNIVEVTHEIRQRKPVSFNRQKMLAERRYSMKLRNDYARIRYKAKLRKCEWPGMTFYAPRKRCMWIKSWNSCPKNQILYDGPGNEGTCDCVQDERGLVYYPNDAQCYQLNVQGPCKDDEWLVLKSYGAPNCDAVPSGCSADGLNVIWPADGKCYKLGKKGPCTESSHVLQRNEFLDVVCMPPSLSTTLKEKHPWGHLPHFNHHMATIDMQKSSNRFFCPPAGRMNQTGTGYCTMTMNNY